MKQDFANMFLNNVMNTDTGQKLFSFLCGLGLTLVFQRVCKDNCTMFYAPHQTDFVDKQFKVEDTCFVYQPYITKCTDKVLLPYNLNDKPVNKIVE